MQVEVAVAGRQIVERKSPAAGFELNAGGRCRHPVDTVAVLVRLLVDVPPQYRPDVGMRLDRIGQLARLPESEVVDPFAAGRQGLMMQAHQDVTLRMANAVRRKSICDGGNSPPVSPSIVESSNTISQFATSTCFCEKISSPRKCSRIMLALSWFPGNQKIGTRVASNFAAR